MTTTGPVDVDNQTNTKVHPPVFAQKHTLSAFNMTGCICIDHAFSCKLQKLVSFDDVRMCSPTHREEQLSRGCGRICSHISRTVETRYGGQGNVFIYLMRQRNQGEAPASARPCMSRLRRSMASTETPLWSTAALKFDVASG